MLHLIVESAPLSELFHDENNNYDE